MGDLDVIVRAALYASAGWLALTALSRLVPLVQVKPQAGEIDLPWPAERVFELLSDPLLDAWSTGAEGVREVARVEQPDGSERIVLVVHDLLGAIDYAFACTWIVESSALRLRESRDGPDQSTRAAYEVQPRGDDGCMLRWLIEVSRRPLISPRSNEVDWTTAWPTIIKARLGAPKPAVQRAELRRARIQAIALQRSGELLVGAAIAFAVTRDVVPSLAFGIGLLLTHRAARAIGDRRRLGRHLEAAGAASASLRTPSTT
jgi:hypothetical protein